MHPLTNDMKQRFIVQYLATLGEYQEVCSITSNLVVAVCLLSTTAGYVFTDVVHTGWVPLVLSLVLSQVRS